MLTIEQQFELSAKSKNALDRIKHHNEEIEAQKNEFKWVRPNYSRMVFEEFTSDSFEDKIQKDSAYYNVLIKRLEENQSENLNKIIGSMMKTVRQIYEHLNIKPKIYGFHRFQSLDDSDDVIEENATRIISDFINRNYYSLTKEERQDKYESSVKAIASDMIINESIDPDIAVKFATKVIVVKNFLENINFPLVIKDEIQHYLTSELYQDMFEHEDLQKLYDDFDNQSFKLAKIIASVV